MFIYLIVNRETGKYYVGQHKGSDLRKYLQQKFSHAQRGVSSASRLYNSMRKHPDPKVWSIHALRSDITNRAELDQTERDFIRFLRSQDPGYGYNICRGGEGFTGPHSYETCVRMSVAIRQAWADPKKRAKQSADAKSAWRDPGSHAKRVESLRESWADPLSRLSRMKAFDNGSFRGKIGEISRKRWNDPKKRVKQSATLKGKWNDPEYRTKMSNFAKAEVRDTDGRFVRVLPINSQTHL